MKQCSRCKKFLSETEFHRDKYSKDGLRYICKECTKKENKSRKTTIRNEYGKKQCCICKNWLNEKDFGRDKKNSDGLKSSCKKCFSERERKYNRKLNRRYFFYKKNATTRGIEFSISKEEFKEITEKPCNYSGILEEYNGIDRLDNSKGYIKGNIVSCCSWANKMKQDKTEKEFAEMICKIYHYWAKNYGDNI